MKMFPYITLFILLLLGGMMAKVKGQVVAVGRVTAEVVESVGASARVTTGFDLQNAAGVEWGTVTTTRLNLGTVTIHGGKDFSYDVVMQSPVVKDKRGNDIEVETAYAEKKKEGSWNPTLQLRAEAKTRSGQASGVYKGTYEMTLAYN